jgi:MATE family multidrug resistance protein
MLLAAEPALTLLQQPSEVVPLAAGYVFRVLPSIWPFFAFVVLRQTLQAHHLTWPVVLTLIAANLINAGLNYLWIYGNLGFPELGVLGSAWATTVSRWIMAGLMLALGWRYLGRYLTGLGRAVFAPEPLLRMLKVGAPIGIQMLLEFGAFATIALLMGWLGVVQVAAHQVAINLASQTFMVAVGISSAAAVVVGHAVGRGDQEGVLRSSIAALALGAGFMTVTALTFVSIPAGLARIYTDEAEVLALAVLLIPIAGVFQVFDGLQAVALGVLRGLGDTRVPMLVSIVGFWCFGMPVSLWLAFGLDHGATGLWWGLVVGLALVATVLVIRIKVREGRKIQRLTIDEHADGVSEPRGID